MVMTQNRDEFFWLAVPTQTEAAKNSSLFYFIVFIFNPL
jgi:hypothetical protein